MNVESFFMIKMQGNIMYLSIGLCGKKEKQESCHHLDVSGKFNMRKKQATVDNTVMSHFPSYTNRYQTSFELHTLEQNEFPSIKANQDFFRFCVLCQSLNSIYIWYFLLKIMNHKLYQANRNRKRQP